MSAASLTTVVASPAVRAKPAGFVSRHHGHRRARPAGRPARPRGGHPADLHRPVLLPREHRRRSRTSPRQHPRASTSRRSRCRRRSCSASPASRGRRRSCSTCRTATSTGCCSRPVRRTSILLGHMVADVTVAIGLIVPITIVGFVVGVRFDTGAARRAASSSLLGALWSLAFTGFGYAIALKTGNPAAVNSSFLLFFPFLFLTTLVRAPRSAVGLARHRRHVQPGDVPARGAALARSTAAGRGTTSVRPCSPS